MIVALACPALKFTVPLGMVLLLVAPELVVKSLAFTVLPATLSTTQSTAVPKLV